MARHGVNAPEAAIDLESEIRELERRLATQTEEAAKNEAILRSSQAREMKLLEAESLQDLLGLLVEGLKSSYRLDATSLVVCDPFHEVRHLLMDDGVEPSSLTGIQFVDAVTDVLPPIANFTRPWLGPYDATAHGRLFSGAVRLGSVALMPLLRQQKLVGSLNFGSVDARRFTSHHATDFLHHLTTIAAFCLENAVNRARLVRSGLTDVLTGMHNRRYLQERLKAELAAAQRHQSPLACLILDVDHFKRVNDTHGHMAGDTVLREIAKRIDSQIRASDVCARFGGEEFAVLLPGTTIEVAANLGERIRQAVSASRIHVSDGVSIPATISVGAAGVVPERKAPVLSAVGEALLARADTALYRAKSDGRNRVRLSS